MKRLVLSLAFLALSFLPATAQTNVRVVSACGAIAPWGAVGTAGGWAGPGQPGYIAVDPTGTACTSGSGGSGGNGGTSTDPPATLPATAAAATQTALLKSIANNTVVPTLATSALVKGVTAAMTATTSTQVIAAVASKSIYVMAIHCNNSSATGTMVNIQDGNAGTTLDVLAAGATQGGDNRTGPTPLFWTTSGNGLYAADVTTGASVICQASGYSG